MKSAIMDVIAFPFYGVGWLFGIVVRALTWCREAAILGYDDGKHGGRRSEGE